MAGSAATACWARAELSTRQGRWRVRSPGAVIILLPNLRDSYLAAAQTYASLGVELIEIDLVDFEPLSALAALVFASEAAATHARALRERGNEMEPQIRERLLQGFAYPAAAYIEAINARAARMRRFVDDVFANAEILLLPSVPDIAPRLADVMAGTPPIATPLEPGYFMRAINYLGLPALAVPCGFPAEGLPLGFQLVGRPFAEGTLLNCGHVFQRETDFHEKVPSGFDD